MKINPEWQITDCGCGAFLMRDGGDPDKISDRYAFIEKTARVRIRSDRHEQWQDFLNWAEGFKGNGCHDLESRKWCEDMLKLLGYQL